MHVRVREFGKPDTIVVVDSKLTKIDQFRKIIRDKFDVDPKLQRLFYGGKLLENGYTFHDYNIKLNDVIQLMVRQQPECSTDDKKLEVEAAPSNSEQDTVEYKDAESKFYKVGDFIDMKDKELGAWHEGKIVRIVINPKNKLVPAPQNFENVPDNSKNQALKLTKTTNSDKESDTENKPPSAVSTEGSPKTKRKGIAKYFTKTSSNVKRKLSGECSSAKTMDETTEEDLLFKVQLEDDSEDAAEYCEARDVRPRARTEPAAERLQPGQRVMVSYDADAPGEPGPWFDFEVAAVQRARGRGAAWLVGTLFLGAGAGAVEQRDVRVAAAPGRVLAVEPREAAAAARAAAPPPRRLAPPRCAACRDDDARACRRCGCQVCAGKHAPDQIVLCDECDAGFHLACLSPPLGELPADDWYCPRCKRDDAVVAPGRRQQRRKPAPRNSRDWGRGMACQGKTKTCAMPANHFGPIPGVEVGMCWRFRIQLSEAGVHRPPVSGIHGRDTEGAYSLVLAGGYEDDVDDGEEFTYTGSGGRDLSGNKRTAEQSADQTLTRENRALARNCAAALSERGADAGAEWRAGRPVRVARSSKLRASRFAPAEGVRYDGIYKVVRYHAARGLSGFLVWRYVLRRDDPAPPPWCEGAPHYPVLYPEGYLEAEAEKKALKDKNAKNKLTKKGKKKRALKESNSSDRKQPPAVPAAAPADPPADSPPAKRLKADAADLVEAVAVTSRRELDVAGAALVAADALNVKLWDECRAALRAGGRAAFVEAVSAAFQCIVCRELAAAPVTTPCRHNFCMACMRRALRAAAGCPACRGALTSGEAAGWEPRVNEQLRAALRHLLPGYDAAR